MVFPKICTGIWSFLYHQERWHFFPQKFDIFFYRQKMKDDLSQRLHGSMMFPVYSIKMVFIFPINMKLPFCQYKLRSTSLEKYN